MIEDSKILSIKARNLILTLSYQNKTSHVGSSLSVVDILAVLYSYILKITPSTVNNKNRDRLYFSKGHACLALYSILHLQGFFKKINLLQDFSKNGSLFTSHVNDLLPGIEISTGSLGNAAGFACGVSYSAKLNNSNFCSYVILSDGELDEGSNWESFLFAGHHKLDNLIFIIDSNKIQSFGNTRDVIDTEPLVEKFHSFNFHVSRVDGHNHNLLLKEIKKLKLKKNKPKVLICDTVKGKGVSFMENKLLWHYKSPDEEEYKRAIKEINS